MNQPPDSNYSDDAPGNDTYSHYFHIPHAVHQGNETSKKSIYFCGNSLGLMPKTVNKYIEAELTDWANLGVEGHVHGSNPWVSYHEILTPTMSKIVGAKSSEVVVMNGLTVNLHLMLASFYRPTPERFKILIEYNPFPSDRYALESQVRFHGYDPAEAIIELIPKDGSEIVDTETIIETIAEYGDGIALIMMAGVNYYSGQLYPIAEITQLGHAAGCLVGFDLAHAAGNVTLNLHDDGVDFAVWCSYKYLNSGPGNLSGCYVHERHHRDEKLPKLTGWWGHNKAERFKMAPGFVPIPTVESWQLSNPPILAMAAIKASLDIFEEVGMQHLVDKSKKMSAYLFELLEDLDTDKIKIITPTNPEARGCQVSIQMVNKDKTLFNRLAAEGIIADWREPDVIRIAPVPLYNTFAEIQIFVSLIKKYL